VKRQCSTAYRGNDNAPLVFDITDKLRNHKPHNRLLSFAADDKHEAIFTQMWVT